MKFKSFLRYLNLNWLHDFMQEASRSNRRSRRGQKARSRLCFLESLEERVVPANTYHVTLATDNTATGQVDASDPTGLSGDLRYVINQADKVVNAGSTIVFNNNLLAGKTITLGNNELQISENMTITGLGSGVLTVSGNNVSRVFDITSQNAIVTISGLTITGGNANPATANFAGNQGGDIFNSGTLTLIADVVSNGVASGVIQGPDGRGGGIFNATGATLVVNSTIVTGNMAIGTGRHRRHRRQ